MHRNFDFTSLPTDVLRHLLLGFSGRPHLHAIASVAMAHSTHADDVFSTIARDALLSAWGENPLDGNCVAALVEQSELMAAMPPAALHFFKAVIAHWQPEITPEAQAAMGESPATQLAFLHDQLRIKPRNLFWWHHLYEFARINGDWEPLAASLATATPPDALAPLFSYATGNALLASGDHHAAAGTYRQCMPALPMPIIEERLATAWLRSGKRDKAAEVLKQCADRRPWNVGLWLRLHELSVDGDHAVVQPEGRTMVLGYSWNRADDLAETLDSLVKSDLHDVHVRILDNDSADNTGEVIRQFVDKYGRDHAAMVTMPVNVGAPAARNWLMHLPEVRKADHVAYIDDDISLPKDWLGRLGAAIRRYPDAGVWGCKVVNYDGPARVQCGEHNLTPTPEERQQTLMSTVMLQDGDFGQADYVRPCASVTGCVHLFRTDRLLDTGDFDLRFSPTQYDDLERDLRMVLGGGYAVYTGFLSILHKRTSGAASDASKPESANALGNLHKLMAKYSPQEFEVMASAMEKVLLADLLAKLSAVTD